MLANTPDLDPQSADLLATFVRDGVRPYDRLSVLRARSMVAGSVHLQAPRTPVARVRDVLVEQDGRAIPARVYDPSPGTITPALCYFHGGGFVTGSVAVADRACRALASGSGWTVISLEYRLAPENPYPAGLQDAVTLVGWVHRRAGDLEVDPGRLVVCGDSAGGALATATAQRLRGTDLAPAGEILVYPTLAPVGDRTSESIARFGELPSLTVGSIDWFWGHYLSAVRTADPDSAPLLQHDLTGHPPTTIVVAGCDLLRDEGLEYADRLRDCGVPTRTWVVPGAVHGFWWMDGVLDQSRELTEYLAADLRRRAGR